MARLTVEDCLDKINNRYDLVLLAGKRARQLSNGVEPLVKPGSDKPTVIALREIAAGLVDMENIEQLGKPQFDEAALEEMELHPSLPPPLPPPADEMGSAADGIGLESGEMPPEFGGLAESGLASDAIAGIGGMPPPAVDAGEWPEAAETPQTADAPVAPDPAAPAPPDDEMTQ